MKKSMLLFSLFCSLSVMTMPTYGMDQLEMNSLTVRSGKQIKELVENGEAHLINTVEVRWVIPRSEYISGGDYYTFDVSDIAHCTNLKKLIIRNTPSFYSDENVLFDDAEDKNAQVMNDIAESCPASLTSLEIRRVPAMLSGGASDKSLQAFAKQAPGITHLTIDAMGHTGSVKVTDEAFVNFPHLQSLVLYDAKDFKGNKIDPSIVTKLSFEDEKCKRVAELNKIFDYHFSRGVPQLQNAYKFIVVDRSANLVVCGDFPNSDTDALIAGWEMATGKRW